MTTAERVIRFLRDLYKPGDVLDTTRSSKDIFGPDEVNQNTAKTIIAGLVRAGVLEQPGRGRILLPETFFTSQPEELAIAYTKARAAYELAAKERKRAPEAPEPPSTAISTVTSIAPDEVLIIEKSAIAGIVGRARTIAAEVARLEEDCSRMRGELERLVSETAVLEKRLEVVRVARLKELAIESPDLPEIFALAEKIEARQRSRGAQETIVQLPATSEYYSCPVVYTSEFCATLGKLTKDEEQQTVRALRNLCSHGGPYPALNSKKLHKPAGSTPAGSSVSRINKELRMTWDKQSERLVVFNIFRHTELYNSEA